MHFEIYVFSLQGKEALIAFRDQHINLASDGLLIKSSKGKGSLALYPKTVSNSFKKYHHVIHDWGLSRVRTSLQNGVGDGNVVLRLGGSARGNYHKPMTFLGGSQ